MLLLPQACTSNLISRQRKNVRDLAGLDFTPSPDGRFVAHVGPFPHFAPPYAQSYFLFLDNVIVYPLPKGAKPLRSDVNGEKPDIVQIRSNRFIGIHVFASRFAWCPNSSRVAFVDCTFNWVQKEGDRRRKAGVEKNRRCSIAVVSPSGSFSLVPLPDAPRWGEISWLNNQQLRIAFPAASTYPWASAENDQHSIADARVLPIEKMRAIVSWKVAFPSITQIYGGAECH